MSGEGETEDRDYEVEARALGWHPLDEFRGAPSDWVDAETFVRRGEQQLPIMRENNRKLQTRARRAEDELADLRGKMEEMNTSLATLRRMAERSDEAGYQRALSDLKNQQREAVRNGDEATFDKIEGEIAKVEATREEIHAPAPAPKTPDQPKGPKATPEFQAWFEENKGWATADQTLGRAAVAAEVELRNSDEVFHSEAELWDRVTDMVAQKYPRRFSAATGTSLPDPPQPSQDNGGSNLRRTAPPVLAPRGGAPASSVKKGGIDSIADPEERKVARASFNSIRRGIPDYSEAEYMKVYVNPGADTIPDAISRKAKANGSARA